MSIPWASSVIFHPSLACRSHSQQQWVWWGQAWGASLTHSFRVLILGALGDSFLPWVRGGTILNASVTDPLVCVVLILTNQKPRAGLNDLWKLALGIPRV